MATTASKGGCVMVDPLIDAINSAKDYGDCYLYGYRVTELALVAELLQRNLVTEDDLHNLFGNFSKMYEIIISLHQMGIKKAMHSYFVESKYPSLGEVVMKAFPDKIVRDFPGAKSIKIRPWNDLRKGMRDG
jgi:hypothetical protein